MLTIADSFGGRGLITSEVISIAFHIIPVVALLIAIRVSTRRIDLYRSRWRVSHVFIVINIILVCVIIIFFI